jgi:2-methylcitrate dehydratase PrpD
VGCGRTGWWAGVGSEPDLAVVRSATEAQFSMPFVVAVAAVRGSVTLGDLHGAGLRDSDVLASVQRVEPVFDEDADASRGRIVDKQRLDELVARIRNIEQVDDMRDVAHLLATVKTGSVTSLGPRTRS